MKLANGLSHQLSFKFEMIAKLCCALHAIEQIQKCSLFRWRTFYLLINNIYDILAFLFVVACLCICLLFSCAVSALQTLIYNSASVVAYFIIR